MTKADVESAKNKAATDAVNFCWIVMFTVLLDKEGFSPEDCGRVWTEVESLCGEMNEGRVSLGNLRKVLADEYNIIF